MLKSCHRFLLTVSVTVRVTQAKQDNSQMVDLQRALDRQDGQLQDKEKALAALRQRLNHLEAQVAREKDGAAQSTARAVDEHHTLAETVKTLEREAATHDTTVKVGTSCGCRCVMVVGRQHAFRDTFLISLCHLVPCQA